jgi:hypothetical protein
VISIVVLRMCVRIAYAVTPRASPPSIDYRSKDEVVRSLHLDPAPNRPPGGAADQARYDSKPGIAESSRDRQDDRVKGADRRTV